MPRRDFLPRSAPAYATRPLRPVGEIEPPPIVPEQPSPESVEHHRLYIERSLRRSREVITAALNEACDEHNAAAGVWCYASTKGLCRPRHERGALAVPPLPLLEDATPSVATMHTVTAHQRTREWQARLRDRGAVR